MVAFELTMPNCGSWNGRWSGERDVHVIFKQNRQVPKDLIGKDFYYRWDDGWTAMVTVRKIDCRSSEYKRLNKLNRGFCGYSWMVNSIIVHGKIIRNE